MEAFARRKVDNHPTRETMFRYGKTSFGPRSRRVVGRGCASGQTAGDTAFRIRFQHASARTGG